jgi:hypothetical protein
MKNLFKILILTLILLSFSCSQVDNKTHSAIIIKNIPINVEIPPLPGIPSFKV